MPVFDFFAELTSTATIQPWLFPALAASQYDRYHPRKPCSSSAPTSSRPVLHDLALNFRRHPTSTPQKSPVLPPSPVQMPLELILAIIEAAYDRDVPDVALLRSCALVCRSWSVPVQKLLFRRVSLRTHHQYAAFHAAATTRPVLRDAVRHLRVVMDYSQPSYLHQHAFARAVAMCANLHDLDIALYGYSDSPSSGDHHNHNSNVLGALVESARLRRRAPSFDDETLAILRRGPAVRSLSFSNWTENQQCLFQLLDLYPTSLRSLSMSGTSPVLPAALAPATVSSYPGMLESLRINFQTAPSLEFMSWLLDESQRAASLRALTFARDPCLDLLDFLMGAFKDDLSSLSIPTCSTPEHAKHISSCAQLSFLRMDRPQLNPLAYKSVPESIRHLVLGIERDTPLQPVIDVVKSRRELGEVTVRLWSGGEGHRLLPALKIACAYRGVELRVTRDEQEYRSLTK